MFRPVNEMISAPRPHPPSLSPGRTDRVLTCTRHLDRTIKVDNENCRWERQTLLAGISHGSIKVPEIINIGIERRRWDVANVSGSHAGTPLLSLFIPLSKQLKNSEATY